MPIALATSSRALMAAMLVGAIGALFTGCGDQSIERKGGGDIPDLNAGTVSIAAGGGQTSEAGGAGASEGGSAGAVSNGLVPWCDAYRVINCVCQQCHQDPTLNGAAMPLITYDNTQVGYPRPTSEAVWKKMQRAVTSGFMPYMGDSTVMPPVKPLSAEQKDTLLTWLMEGAHDEGGTDCTKTCDWSDGTPEL